MCSNMALEDVSQMFVEISRVLQPGGVYMLITLGDPSHR